MADDSFTIPAGGSLYAGFPRSTTAPTDNPLQYVLTDAGIGPTDTLSNRHLQIAWNTPMGDWIDANGVARGSTPYNTPVALSVGVHEIAVTALVQKWQVDGVAKSFYIIGNGSLSWSGRLSTNPPVLLVQYADRVDTLPVLSSACWSSSSVNGIDARITTNVSGTRRAGISIDASLLEPGIVSARLRLNITVKGSGTGSLSIYEADPPPYRIIEQTDPDVTYGIADIADHPSILTRPSFGRLTPYAGGWSDVNLATGAEVVYDDPKFPGEPVFRSLFRGTTTQDYRSSSSFWVEYMRADTTLPGWPNKMPHNSDHMHCRLYIFLEDDWRTSLDGNKMGIGWDLRMGYWNPASGGKWQSTTGNGGAPGTGLKLFPGPYSPSDRIEYQGHSIRMEGGRGPSDPADPYESLRPVESYIYHLDQDGGYGDRRRHGRAVFRRGRWHCVEQAIYMNSVVGPFDSLGNGTAVRDGRLMQWLDGVLIDSINNFAWRRNLEMGIQGPWINWFFGGKDSSPIDMHYRMADMIVAKEYIGPRAS